MTLFSLKGLAIKKIAIVKRILPSSNPLVLPSWYECTCICLSLYPCLQTVSAKSVFSTNLDVHVCKGLNISNTHVVGLLNWYMCNTSISSFPIEYLGIFHQVSTRVGPLWSTSTLALPTASSHHRHGGIPGSGDVCEGEDHEGRATCLYSVRILPFCAMCNPCSQNI